MGDELVLQPSPHLVTELLAKWRAGDQDALGALVPLVYNELQKAAHRYLRHERPDHTLQSTALVHEAYLRLRKQGAQELKNRAHFFAIAAQLMRQILVEYARHRNAEKLNGWGSSQARTRQTWRIGSSTYMAGYYAFQEGSAVLR